MESFGRQIDYLRVSVTERCNERCLYCRPHPRAGWNAEEILTDAELLRIVRVAASLGFRKIRLTGGEPLLRKNLVALVAEVRALTGIEHIGLSTNGVRLPALARELCAAGVRTVNISLDALTSEVYQRITGLPVGPVLEGIRSAQAAGFAFIKLNTVLMRDVNGEEIWPLIRFSAQNGIPLRLIEQMPVTSREVLLTPESFLSIGEVIRRLRRREHLEPLPNARLGHGPAKYYRLTKSGAIVGFIGSLTNRHFCHHCNKMRLTADGRLRPCLGHHEEVSLREALADTASDELLRRLFHTARVNKPWDHAFHDNYSPGRPMTAIGG